jgi:Protein related to penicillin acylase
LSKGAGGGVSRRDHAVLAASVVVLVLLLLTTYLTPVGVLFSASNPYTGVYGYSLNAVLRSETLHVKGLYRPVRVIVDRYGVYHIYAQDLHDLFLAFGFIQAENRLFQLDLFRRAAIGNLSPILGPSYRSYDLFQLKIGNYITAERDWNETLELASTDPMANITVMALEAYSQGVNDYIEYAEAHHELPFEFTLLRYTPQPWTPVDSFAVQQYMVESLEFGDDPLILSLMYYKMGQLANYLNPPFSPIPQVYYAGYNGPPNATVEEEAKNIWPINSTIAQMAYELYKEWDPPFISPHAVEHSNEWVVCGNKTATGRSNTCRRAGPGLQPPLHMVRGPARGAGLRRLRRLPAGGPRAGYRLQPAHSLDPHGREAISWGTFFFVQTVNGTDYYFNGSWHPIIHYYVDGIELNWTNWGPIMIQNKGLALVMYWLGNTYSNDFGVLFYISNASNWQQFYDALRHWHVPYQNFAYADVYGNIGDVSAGIYPIFASSGGGIPYSPDAIMPGDGQVYVKGFIPYEDIPHAFNPPSCFIVSSNQRQVGPSYPYWYGDSMSFSPGTRAWVVYDYLLYHNNVTLQDMMRLQWNETDLAAAWSMPTIIRALEQDSSNPYVATALSYLEGWNYTMSPNSKAATIWFYIYSEVYFNVIYGLFNRTGFWPEFSAVRPGPAGGSWPGTFGLALARRGRHPHADDWQRHSYIQRERRPAHSQLDDRGHEAPRVLVPQRQLHLGQLLRLLLAEPDRRQGPQRGPPERAGRRLLHPQRPERRGRRPAPNLAWARRAELDIHSEHGQPKRLLRRLPWRAEREPGEPLLRQLHPHMDKGRVPAPALHRQPSGLRAVRGDC